MVNEFSHQVVEWVTAVVPVQDPPPGIEPVSPQAPPGGAREAVTYVVAVLMWMAGLGALGLFFGGIVMASAGRFSDHRGSGQMGSRMMVGGVVLAVLYGIGYTLINSFATQQFGS